MKNVRDPYNQLLPPKPPGKKWTLMLFAVVGLLLHAPFLAIPATWLFSKGPVQRAKKRVVMIHRASQMRSPRNRKVVRQFTKRKRRLIQQRRPLPPPRKRPKKKPPEPPKPRGQIVDVAPTPDDRPPPDARFLSEYNTRVKKQSVSRFRKLKYKMAAPRPLRKKRPRPKQRRALVASRIYAPRSPFKRLRLTSPTPKRTKKTPRKVKRTKPKPRNARKKINQPKLRKRRRVALTKDKQGQAAPRPQPKDVQGRKQFSLNLGPPLKLDPSLTPIYRQGGATRIPPRAVDLRPNFGTLSRISGNPAPDHIKGVAEGDATLLNSRRYMYASFFNRVKQQIAQHWNPNGVYRRRDPYGNVYGVRDRSTTVSVELFQDGKIAAISVAQTCGLSFLDNEAVRAFRAAQPFPNPPKGLLDNDGKIRFKFSFFLQVSSGPGFRLFR